MKAYLKLFAKTAVAILVLAHMASVVAFSIPAALSGGFPGKVRGFMNERTRPYMMLASQWQEWNLFAPDPLRRVTTFAVDIESGVHWKPVASFEPGAFPWWRHATYAKLLPALLDSQRFDTDATRERFLQLLCRDMGIAHGTMVRLREVTSVIPYVHEHQSQEWWSWIDPEETSAITRLTSCSPYAL